LERSCFTDCHSLPFFSFASVSILVLEQCHWLQSIIIEKDKQNEINEKEEEHLFISSPGNSLTSLPSSFTTTVLLSEEHSHLLQGTSYRKIAQKTIFEIHLMIFVLHFS
jgi:hypothetical protein